MDTDSLIFSFKLNLTPFRAIDRIESQYHLIFPSKVIDEYKDELRTPSKYREIEDVRKDVDLFLRVKQDSGAVISEDEYSRCINYVEKWYTLTNRQREFYNLGDGEKHCMALGLYWNRKHKSPLFVITDDFRAIKAGLSCFVLSQRVGITYSLPEIMISIFLSTKEIRRINILGFMNDYFNLNKVQKSEIKDLRMKYVNEVLSSCREVNVDNCGQLCYARDLS